MGQTCWRTLQIFFQLCDLHGVSIVITEVKSLGMGLGLGVGFHVQVAELVSDGTHMQGEVSQFHGASKADRWIFIYAYDSFKL